MCFPVEARWLLLAVLWGAAGAYTSTFVLCLTDQQMRHSTLVIPRSRVSTAVSPVYGSNCTAGAAAAGGGGLLSSLRNADPAACYRTHLQASFAVISTTAEDSRDTFEPTVLTRLNAVPTLRHNFGEHGIRRENGHRVVLTDQDVFQEYSSSSSSGGGGGSDPSAVLVSSEDVLLHIAVWGGQPAYNTRYFSGSAVQQCVRVDVLVAYSLLNSSSSDANYSSIPVAPRASLGAVDSPTAPVTAQCDATTAALCNGTAAPGSCTEILHRLANVNSSTLLIRSSTSMDAVLTSIYIANNANISTCNASTGVTDALGGWGGTSRSPLSVLWADSAGALYRSGGETGGSSVSAEGGASGIYVELPLRKDGSRAIGGGSSSGRLYYPRVGWRLVESAGSAGGSRELGTYRVRCPGQVAAEAVGRDATFFAGAAQCLRNGSAAVALDSARWVQRSTSPSSVTELHPLPALFSAVVPMRLLLSSVYVTVGGYLHATVTLTRTVVLHGPAGAGRCQQVQEQGGASTSTWYSTGNDTSTLLSLDPEDVKLVISTGAAVVATDAAGQGEGEGEGAAAVWGEYHSSFRRRSTSAVCAPYTGTDGAAGVELEVSQMTTATEFVWLIPKPAIALFGSNDADSGRIGVGEGDAALFVSLLPVYRTDTEEAAALASAPTSPKDNIGDVNTSVLLSETVTSSGFSAAFVACPEAPSRSLYEYLSASTSPTSPAALGLCNPNHGTCVVQYGDLAVTRCVCRYPWEGDTCDDLSVPWAEYVLQVLMLTLSNLIMAPAVWYCFRRALCATIDTPDSAPSTDYEPIGSPQRQQQQQHAPSPASTVRVTTPVLLVVGVVLGLSAGSSLLYHLCDTDALCALGIGFPAWQVYDVLFSVLSMACVVLFHAPGRFEARDWEREGEGEGRQHAGMEWKAGEGQRRRDDDGLRLAALCVLVLGVLLAPVGNDPTDPMNVVLGLGLAFSLLLLLWGGCALQLYYCRYWLQVLSRRDTGESQATLVRVAAAGVQEADGEGSAGIELGLGVSDEAASPPVDGGREPEPVPADAVGTPGSSPSPTPGGGGSARYSLLPSSSSSAQPASAAAEDPKCGTAPALPHSVRRTSCDLLAALNAVKFTALGVVLAVAGMLSFAFQSARLYWVVHSTWHACMMLAALCLLRGRDDTVRVLKAGINALVARLFDQNT